MAVIHCPRVVGRPTRHILLKVIRNLSPEMLQKSCLLESVSDGTVGLTASFYFRVQVSSSQLD